MSVTTIQDEILGLPAKKREAAWAAESERRIDAYDASKLTARDATKVFADLKTRLHKSATIFVLLLMGILNLTAQENSPTPLASNSPQDQFNSIDAWDLAIVKTTLVSSNGASPVFSPDCGKLAYIETSLENLSKTIVIKSLPDLQTEKTFLLVGGQSSIAWSPNGKRIVSVNKDSGKVTVIEVETGKQIDLPDVDIHDGDIFWQNDDVISSSKGQAVNLNTLSVIYTDYTQVQNGIVETLRRSSHPKLYLEFGTDGSSYQGNVFQMNVFVSSKNQNYKKLLCNRARDQSTYHSWSSDARYIARVARDHVVLLTLGKGKPLLNNFPLEDFQGADNVRDKIVDGLSRGQPISAEIYAPKANPLTEKVVGPTGDNKAYGDIRLQDGQLIFTTTTQLSPINEGDVISRIMWWTSSDRGSGGGYGENVFAIVGKTGTNSNNPSENNSIVPAPLQETLTKAQAGDTQAQLDLGLAYQQGKGVGRDSDQAMQWFRKAAEQGNAVAQARLGMMYNIPKYKNYDEELKWLRKSADQNCAMGQNALGVMYSVGNGVEQDDAQAIKLFQQSAEQDYAGAEYELGFAYQNGQGVRKNYAQAISWYLKAAEQGDPMAQNNLGEMYQNGQGVTKDNAEAVKWFQKSADQGNFFAKLALQKIKSSQ